MPRSSWRPTGSPRRIRVLGPLVLCSLVAACGASDAVVSPAGSADGAPSPPTTGSPLSTPGAADIAAGRQLIEQIDLTDEASIEAAGDLRYTAGGAEAARAVLESDASTDAIWAAIWVYATVGSDPAPLRRHADAADPSIAAMAATTLVAFGDAAGFPALERALGSDAPLSGSHPPVGVRDLALTTLTRYVAAPGAPVPGADGGGDATAAWLDWLADNGDQLHFDDARGVWGLP